MDRVEIKLPFKPYKPLDVIAVGNANIDITLYVNRVPAPDEAVEASSILISGGGAASNFAIASSRLGCKVGFIGCVGDDDYGKLLLEEFKREGVDVSKVMKAKDKPTGLVLIIVEPDGSRRMIAYRGANLDLNASIVDVDYLKSANILHIASIRPEIAYDITRKAIEAGVIISYDPGSIAAKQGVKALKPILERTTILFLNRRELLGLMGSSNVENTLKIVDLGVRIIALKIGEKGSILITRDRIIHIPPYKPDKIIDTTGAGDIYAAAFITSLIKGKDLIDSGIYASVAAGIKISKPGARRGSPYRYEVDSKIKGIGNYLKRKVTIELIQ